MLHTSLKSLLALLLVFSFTSTSLAWGKRGHSLVAMTAAYLVAQDQSADFLKAHSFDMGYYANVPDLVWKLPATYSEESYNHFMDLEAFERGLKGTKIENPYALSRIEFNKAFPEIQNKEGRSWWRIREFQETLGQITTKLKQTDLSVDEHQKLQADWLITAGTMGHYVGDLAQPLHCTENYDGQLTGQKGVHAFFEDDVVDNLYPDLESEVLKGAQKLWPKFSKDNAKKDTLSLIRELTLGSQKALPELLKIDKKVGRTDMTKATRAYHAMILEHMITGTLTLAELWHRNIGWTFDSHKFYIFVSTPPFVKVPQAPVAEEPKKK